MAKTLTLTDITGIGEVAAKALRTSGIKTPKNLAKAKVKKIAAVHGFGATKAAASKKVAKALLKNKTKTKKKSGKKKAKKKKKGKKKK